MSASSSTTSTAVSSGGPRWRWPPRRRQRARRRPARLDHQPRPRSRRRPQPAGRRPRRGTGPAARRAPSSVARRVVVEQRQAPHARRRPASTTYSAGLWPQPTSCRVLRQRVLRVVDHEVGAARNSTCRSILAVHARESAPAAGPSAMAGARAARDRSRTPPRRRRPRAGSRASSAGWLQVARRDRARRRASNAPSTSS